MKPMFDETQVEAAASRTDISSGTSYESAATAVRENVSRPNCVLEMVATQAAVNPNATAVATGSAALTYGELECRSNQIARCLQSAGVGSDQLVGLSMERSPAMVVAALAILKAGGAYVPLDAMLPAERLDFMLRDAEVRVLVADDAAAAKLPSGSWQMVNVQKQARELGAFSSDPFPSLVTEKNLAYVIYTSGSTGQPKGVEITHGGLANLVSWHCRAFEVTSRDRASHQAAVGFDAAVWEIWPYLAAGASVYIPPETCRANPEALRDWFVAQRISITFLATPLAERMLVLDWPRDTALRVLLTGADTLHRRPSPNLPFVLVNNYGPTECTVVASSGTVDPADPSNPTSSLSNRLPSIGRAIDNTQIHIVDAEMKAVPAGTAGELCVAGAGLARGYHNRAELTREKFVPNPFSSRPGDRLYRTGDLARRLPNGEIEFLGRIDEQIKIRGFRIEPNEIVGALDEHPAVAASAVLAYENPQGSQAGEKSLVAYVVLTDAAAITGSVLREHLGKRLPEYMVPSAFVRVEALPLTANGKVDRTALPAPGDADRLHEDNYVAPSGIVQQRLAAIIASLLHVDRIGANDNFFLLGGHSLLGTQLIARVSEVFGVELPLLQLFDHPTLAEMSGAIEKMILAKLEQTNPGDDRPPADQTSV
jgi:amino acid adenylation domain-containing protein